MDKVIRRRVLPFLLAIAMLLGNLYLPGGTVEAADPISYDGDIVSEIENLNFSVITEENEDFTGGFVYGDYNIYLRLNFNPGYEKSPLVSKIHFKVVTDFWATDVDQNNQQCTNEGEATLEWVESKGFWRICVPIVSNPDDLPSRVKNYTKVTLSNVDTGIPTATSPDGVVGIQKPDISNYRVYTLDNKELTDEDVTIPVKAGDTIQLKLVAKEGHIFNDRPQYEFYREGVDAKGHISDVTYTVGDSKTIYMSFKVNAGGTYKINFLTDSIGGGDITGDDPNVPDESSFSVELPTVDNANVVGASKVAKDAESYSFTVTLDNGYDLGNLKFTCNGFGINSPQDNGNGSYTYTIGSAADPIANYAQNDKLVIQATGQVTVPPEKKVLVSIDNQIANTQLLNQDGSDFVSSIETAAGEIITVGLKAKEDYVLPAINDIQFSDVNGEIDTIGNYYSDGIYYFEIQIPEDASNVYDLTITGDAAGGGSGEAEKETYTATVFMQNGLLANADATAVAGTPEEVGGYWKYTYTVSAGSNLNVTAAAAEGYSIKDGVKVSSTPIEGKLQDLTYTIENLRQDVTISFSFGGDGSGKDAHKVTLKAAEGYSIVDAEGQDLTGIIEMTEDDSYTFFVKVDEGYAFPDDFIMYAESETENPCTVQYVSVNSKEVKVVVNNVKDDVTLSTTTLEATEGETSGTPGSGTNPGDPQPPAKEKNSVYIATGDHLKAYRNLDEWENGNDTFTQTSVDYDADLTFFVVADAGYMISAETLSVVPENVQVMEIGTANKGGNADDSYYYAKLSFLNVTETSIVKVDGAVVDDSKVSFEITVPDFNGDDKVPGIIIEGLGNGTDPVTVNKGGNLTFTATLDEGYSSFGDYQIIVDGKVLEPTYSTDTERVYVISNIQENMDITTVGSPEVSERTVYLSTSVENTTITDEQGNEISEISGLPGKTVRFYVESPEGTTLPASILAKVAVGTAAETDLVKDYFVSANRCRFSYTIPSANLSEDIRIRVVGSNNPDDPGEVVTATRTVTVQLPEGLSMDVLDNGKVVSVTPAQINGTDYEIWTFEVENGTNVDICPYINDVNYQMAEGGFQAWTTEGVLTPNEDGNIFRLENISADTLVGFEEESLVYIGGKLFFSAAEGIELEGSNGGALPAEGVPVTEGEPYVFTIKASAGYVLDLEALEAVCDNGTVEILSKNETQATAVVIPGSQDGTVRVSGAKKETHRMTLAAADGYSIVDEQGEDLTGVLEVTKDDVTTFYVKVEEGYQFPNDFIMYADPGDKCVVQCVAVDDDTRKIVVTNVTDNLTLTTTTTSAVTGDPSNPGTTEPTSPEREKSTVYVVTGDHLKAYGKINPSELYTDTEVAYGEDLEVYVVADTGYKIDSSTLTVAPEGVEVIETGKTEKDNYYAKLKVINVTEDVIVKVGGASIDDEKTVYTVELTNTDGIEGIDISGDFVLEGNTRANDNVITVNRNGSVTFNATLKEGYSSFGDFKVMVDGKTIEPIESTDTQRVYRISDIVSNLMVTMIGAAEEEIRTVNLSTDINNTIITNADGEQISEISGRPGESVTFFVESPEGTKLPASIEAEVTIGTSETKLSKDFFVSANKCRFTYKIPTTNLGEDINIVVKSDATGGDSGEVENEKYVVTVQLPTGLSMNVLQNGEVLDNTAPVRQVTIDGTLYTVWVFEVEHGKDVDICPYINNEADYKISENGFTAWTTEGTLTPDETGTIFRLTDVQADALVGFNADSVVYTGRQLFFTAEEGIVLADSTGAAIPADGVQAKEGEPYVFTITAADGYTLDLNAVSAVCDNATVEIINKGAAGCNAVVIPGAENSTIHVSGAVASQYNVQLMAGEGFKLVDEEGNDVSGTIKMTASDTYTYYVEAQEGYEFGNGFGLMVVPNANASCSVVATENAARRKAEVSNVTGDVTISTPAAVTATSQVIVSTAEHLKAYKDASATQPLDVETVNYNENLEFYVYAEEGYMITKDGLQIEGGNVSVLEVGKNNIGYYARLVAASVKEDTIIHIGGAIVDPDNTYYTATLANNVALDGIDISGAFTLNGVDANVLTAKVAMGESLSFTATTKAGYNFNDFAVWCGNEEVIPSSTSETSRTYIIENVQSDLFIRLTGTAQKNARRVELTTTLDGVVITDGNGNDITELWGVPGEVLTFYVESEEGTKLPADLKATEIIGGAIPGTDLTNRFFVTANKCRFVYTVSDQDMDEDLRIQVSSDGQVVKEEYNLTIQLPEGLSMTVMDNDTEIPATKVNTITVNGATYTVWTMTVEHGTNVDIFPYIAEADQDDYRLADDGLKAWTTAGTLTPSATGDVFRLENVVTDTLVGFDADSVVKLGRKLTFEAPEGMIVYDENGNVISAKEPILVKEGQYYAFAIGAAEGYYLNLDKVSASCDNAEVIFTSMGTDKCYGIVKIGSEDATVILTGTESATFKVTLPADMEGAIFHGANTATVNQEYVLTLTVKDGYNIGSLDVLVNGIILNAEKVNENTYTYTVPASFVTGDLVFTTTGALEKEYYTVDIANLIEGATVTDLTGAQITKIQDVTYGQTINFLLKAEEGKELPETDSITVTANGTVVYNTISEYGSDVYLVTYQVTGNTMLTLAGTTSTVENPLAFYVQEGITVNADVITGGDVSNVSIEGTSNVVSVGNVDYNSNLSFNVSVDENLYKISEDGIQISVIPASYEVTSTGENSYTIEGIKAPVIISVTGVERLDVYKVAFDTSEAFTIGNTQVDGKDTSLTNNWLYADEGDSVTFNLTKDGAYSDSIIELTASNGQELRKVSTDGLTTIYEIKNVTADTVISATVQDKVTVVDNTTAFADGQFTITTTDEDVTEENQNSLATNKTMYVPTATEVTYTITYNEPEKFNGSKPTLVYTDANNTQKAITLETVDAEKGIYTFTLNTKGNTTIEITSALVTNDYVVSVSEDSVPEAQIQVNGADLDDTNNKVAHGENFAFTVELPEQYVEDAIVVTANGTVLERSEAGNYVIRNVTENQVIKVSNLVVKTYTVTLPTEVKGLLSIDKPGANTVNHGDTFTFQIEKDLINYPNSEPVFTATNGYTVEVVDAEEGIYEVRNIKHDVDINITMDKYTLLVVREGVIDGKDVELLGEDGASVEVVSETGSYIDVTKNVKVALNYDKNVYESVVLELNGQVLSDADGDGYYIIPKQKDSGVLRVIATPKSFTIDIKLDSAGITMVDAKTNGQEIARFEPDLGLDGTTIVSITPEIIYGGSYTFYLNVPEAYKWSRPTFTYTYVDENGEQVSTVLKDNDGVYVINNIVADGKLTMETLDKVVVKAPLTEMLGLITPYVLDTRSDQYVPVTDYEKSPANNTLTFYAPTNKRFQLKIDMPEGYNKSNVTVTENGIAMEEYQVQYGQKDADGNTTVDNYYFTSNNPLAGETEVIVGGIQKNTYVVTLPFTQEGITIGVVSGDPQSVPYDGTFQFTVTKNFGYTQSNIVVKTNGQVLTPNANGVYTINNIRQNQKVTVDGVRLNVYTVTYPVIEGLEIKEVWPSDPDAVTHGTDFQFKACLKKGYKGSRITVKVGRTTLYPDANGIYTIPNVDDYKTIKVTGVRKDVEIVVDDESLRAGDTTHVEVLNVPEGSSLELHNNNPRVAVLDQDGNLYCRKGGTAKLIATTYEYGERVVTTKKVKIKKTSLTFRKTDGTYKVGKLYYEIILGPRGSRDGLVRVASNQDVALIGKKVTIPNKVKIKGKTYKVTEIEAGAFSDMKQIEEVNIPRYVHTVASSAFLDCKNLTKFTIHKRNQYFRTIEDGACLVYKNTIRAYPSASGKFVAPAGIHGIGEYAFMETDVTEVVLHKNVKKVGSCAFAYCNKLKKITFKNKKAKSLCCSCVVDDVYYKCVVYVPKKSYKDYKKIFNDGQVSKQLKVRKSK